MKKKYRDLIQETENDPRYKGYQKMYVASGHLEGYSMEEVGFMHISLFENQCPIQFKGNITEEEFEKISMIKILKFFWQYLQDNGPVKLTPKGNMPDEVINAIYKKAGLIIPCSHCGDDMKPEEGLSIIPVMSAVAISQCFNQTFVKNNYLHLSDSKPELLTGNASLYKYSFLAFVFGLNWQCLDGFGNREIGPYAIGFMLMLLSKFGDKFRSENFYSEKYFKTFPHLIDCIKTMPHIKKAADDNHLFSVASICYNSRVFGRFLEGFGLIECEEMENETYDVLIRKSELFDKLITVIPPMGKEDLAD